MRRPAAAANSAAPAHTILQKQQVKSQMRPSPSWWATLPAGTGHRPGAASPRAAGPWAARALRAADWAAVLRRFAGVESSVERGRGLGL